MINPFGIFFRFIFKSFKQFYSCLLYTSIEEAYEISNEDDFNKLDMSIRGEVPDGYFKQKTAYEIIAGDWSSDVCSSDLRR